MSPPLDRCPVCAADLAALPPPGRCPGCGFEFDADTRVWRSPQTWVRLALLYMAGGLAVGLATALLYPAGLARAPRATLPLILGAAAPACGLLLRRVVGGRITGRFVAVTPAGLLLGTRARPRLVPWEEFDRLVVERGVLKVQRRGEAALLPLDDLFAGPGDEEGFRSHVLRVARARTATVVKWGRDPAPPE